MQIKFSIEEAKASDQYFDYTGLSYWLYRRSAPL
jgi:hypothetical protein